MNKKMKKKNYFIPRIKTISADSAEIMADSKLNSDMGDQTVTPTTDGDYDGEFGAKGNSWD